jgi:hypothetical protein
MGARAVLEFCALLDPSGRIMTEIKLKLQIDLDLSNKRIGHEVDVSLCYLPRFDAVEGRPSSAVPVAANVFNDQVIRTGLDLETPSGRRIAQSQVHVCD